jgi:hypothetical protein
MFAGGTNNGMLIAGCPFPSMINEYAVAPGTLCSLGNDDIVLVLCCGTQTDTFVLASFADRHVHDCVIAPKKMRPDNKNVYHND